MAIWSRFLRHVDLMSRMFAKTGAVGDSFALAEESSIKQAIIRCQACRSENDCANFLGGAPDGEAAPDFCLNKALIDRLRDVRRVAG